MPNMPYSRRTRVLPPGEALKKWRGKTSQTAVGAAIGVSGSAVGAWERGDAQPTPDNVRAVDAFLDANGAIMAAYGIGPAGDDVLDVVRQVLAAVAALERRIDELERRRPPSET